ncbi:MAG: T9SS type A sorting domain-containing protein [Saprospiraceae bacterium]|nr:T9SS type A sorting domain-containing protein [Saprospiraceae bacterium]
MKIKQIIVQTMVAKYGSLCQEGNHKLSFDVSRLPSGTYYLLVSDGKQQVIEKFVKQ